MISVERNTTLVLKIVDRIVAASSLASSDNFSSAINCSFDFFCSSSSILYNDEVVPDIKLEIAILSIS